MGSINTLILGQADALYGISDKAVFRINAGDLSSETLHEGGGKYLAEDRFGNLYFARGARLFRLVRE